MKKNKVILFSLLSAYSTPFFAKYLTYNNDKVAQECKKGKVLWDELLQKRKSVEDKLKELSTELQKDNELLQKQTKNPALFSEKKIREQKSKLEKEFRNAQRFQKTEQEELEIEYEEKYSGLKSEISTYASQVWKSKKGELLFDVSPNKRKEIGLEAFDESSDITDDVLKLADSSFESTQKKTAAESIKETKNT